MKTNPTFIIDHAEPTKRQEIPFTVKWARTESEALQGIHKHMGAQNGTYVVIESHC